MVSVDESPSETSEAANDYASTEDLPRERKKRKAQPKQEEMEDGTGIYYQSKV